MTPEKNPTTPLLSLCMFSISVIIFSLQEHALNYLASPFFTPLSFMLMRGTLASLKIPLIAFRMHWQTNLAPPCLLEGEGGRKVGGERMKGYRIGMELEAKARGFFS